MGNTAAAFVSATAAGEAPQCPIAYGPASAIGIGAFVARLLLARTRKQPTRNTATLPHSPSTPHTDHRFPELVPGQRRPRAAQVHAGEATLRRPRVA